MSISATVITGRTGNGGRSGTTCSGSASSRSSRRNTSARRDVLDHQHRDQHRRHHPREPEERQPDVPHRQQVGQVRDGQQQGGGVGHPQAGVGAGPRRDPGGRGGRQHDGREQHDGGVERQRRGDQGREHEDAGEQRHGVVAAQPAYAAGGRGEDARPAADVADDQDGDEEEDDRAEVPQLVAQGVDVQGTRREGRRRGDHADRCLGPAARVQVRRGEQDEESGRRHQDVERRHRVNVDDL